MAAGVCGSGGSGGGVGGAARSEAITILPHNLSGDGIAPEVDEVVEHADGDDLPLSDVSEYLPPSNELLDGRSSEAETKQGVARGWGIGGKETSAAGLAPETGVLPCIPLTKLDAVQT